MNHSIFKGFTKCSGLLSDVQPVLSNGFRVGLTMLADSFSFADRAARRSWRATGLPVGDQKPVNGCSYSVISMVSGSHPVFSSRHPLIIFQKTVFSCLPMRWRTSPAHIATPLKPSPTIYESARTAQNANTAQYRRWARAFTKRPRGRPVQFRFAVHGPSPALAEFFRLDINRVMSARRLLFVKQLSTCPVQ